MHLDVMTIRVVAGVLFVVIVGIIVQRRRSRAAKV
jgi:hypothetical protein